VEAKSHNTEDIGKHDCCTPAPVTSRRGAIPSRVSSTSKTKPSRKVLPTIMLGAEVQLLVSGKRKCGGRSEMEI